MALLARVTAACVTCGDKTTAVTGGGMGAGSGGNGTIVMTAATAAA